MASLEDASTSPRDVHTYHCLCTHLLLASTQPLQTLPKRSSPDKSHILQLPPQPPRELHTEDHLSDYAVLLGTTLERSPVIIRGEEGFEKRYLQKCGRCSIIVGYQLDKSQYGEEKQLGRRDDVIYLLPGGLLTTEEMAAGKDMSPVTAID